MIVILPVDSGSFSATLSDHDHLVTELDDDRTKVEDDLPSFGLHELRLVVQERDELALRRGRRLHPHGLHARPLEHRHGRSICAGASDTRQHRSQSLLCGW